MPANGGEAVQVTRSGRYGQFESPDGRFLYYTKYPEPSPLFRMPAGGGAEEQVLQEVVAHSAFGITAKGIYFMPDIDTIQFLDTAASRISTLATKHDTIGSYLCASTDDAYVVWMALDRASIDLMLVEGFR